MHILDTIIEHKRLEIERLKKTGVPEPATGLRECRGLEAALSQGPHPAIIAEVKKASPSKGVIKEDFDPVQVATAYEKNGASGVSVLTDERFFMGSPAFLTAIKREIALPVLRKDFIVDHIQVEETAAMGADAMLLIVACLDDVLLKELLHHASECGLDTLVETHDEREAERALKAGARIIGINNRDLRDFSVDIETTFRVMAQLPEDVLVVSESGIGSVEDFKRLKDHGVHGALVGEAFMRNPELLIGFVEVQKGIG